MQLLLQTLVDCGSNATNFHNFTQKQLTITLPMVAPQQLNPNEVHFEWTLDLFAPTPPPSEPRLSEEIEDTLHTHRRRSQSTPPQQ